MRPSQDQFARAEIDGSKRLKSFLMDAGLLTVCSLSATGGEKSPLHSSALKKANKRRKLV